jgi:hypothetical protein
LEAKRSAWAAWAAAKNSSISAAGGLTGWTGDAAAGKGRPLFCPARSDSRSVNSPCAWLDGVVSRLNFGKKPRTERRQEHAGEHNSAKFERNKGEFSNLSRFRPHPELVVAEPSRTWSRLACRAPTGKKNTEFSNGRPAGAQDLGPFHLILNSNSRVSDRADDSPPRRRNGTQRRSFSEPTRLPTKPCLSSETGRPREAHQWHPL